MGVSMARDWSLPSSCCWSSTISWMNKRHSRKHERCFRQRKEKESGDNLALSTLLW